METIPNFVRTTCEVQNGSAAREVLHTASKDDIQDLFKETIAGFMEKGLEAELGDEGQSQILCKLQMRHEQSRIIHCARQRIYPTAALCAV